MTNPDEVSDGIRLTFMQLTRACQVEPSDLIELIDEGVLDPVGNHPDVWVFTAESLPRALTAIRVSRQFGLDPAATALVVDLLDKISDLRTRLQYQETLGDP